MGTYLLHYFRFPRIITYDCAVVLWYNCLSAPSLSHIVESLSGCIPFPCSSIHAFSNIDLPYFLDSPRRRKESTEKSTDSRNSLIDIVSSSSISLDPLNCHSHPILLSTHHRPPSKYSIKSMPQSSSLEEYYNWETQIQRKPSR